MQYEIITMDEKKIAGISARTSNSDEKMPEIIGVLWRDFFTKGICDNIPDRANDITIGLYSNYEDGIKGQYDVTVGYEVSETAMLSENVQYKTIAAGKYAKFEVNGNSQAAVAEFWSKLWQMPLDRSYTSDFEEYIPGEDGLPAQLNIFIGLK